MPILNSINQMQDQMTEWRQDLHKIPEIGLQEYETSKYIKNKLKEFNIDFKDGYAGTGIVAWVEGQNNNSETDEYEDHDIGSSLFGRNRTLQYAARPWHRRANASHQHHQW